MVVFIGNYGWFWCNWIDVLVMVILCMGGEYVDIKVL